MAKNREKCLKTEKLKNGTKFCLTFLSIFSHFKDLKSVLLPFTARFLSMVILTLIANLICTCAYNETMSGVQLKVKKRGCDQ
jgi:hypothetical protein